MRIVAIAAATLLAPGAALAQTNPATVTPFQLAGTYTQNFDTLANSGTTGTALPQGFQVIEAGTNADSSYAIGTGSSNAGNSYSFGATNSTERALGSLGSGGLSSIFFGGVFTNALGGTITSLAFDYFGEQWRLSDSTDDGLTFSYRVGATDVSAGTWTTATALGFTPLFANGTSGGAALDGNLATNRRRITATISGLSIAAGQTFGFRWNDVNSSGSDQGLAVDDLSITGTLAQTGAVPEVTSWALMIAGFGVAGVALRRRPGRVATA